MATVTRPSTALPSSGDDMLAEQVTDWINNLLAFLESTNLDEGNVDLTSTDGLMGKSTAQTVTGLKTLTSTAAAAGGVRTALKVAHDPASGTAAANDGIAIEFEGDDASGVATTFAKVEVVYVTATAGSEDAKVVVKVMIGGSLTAGLTVGVSSGGFPFLQIGTIRMWDDPDTSSGGLRILRDADPTAVTDGAVVQTSKSLITD